VLVHRKLIIAIKIDPVGPAHEWERELRLFEHRYLMFVKGERISQRQGYNSVGFMHLFIASEKRGRPLSHKHQRLGKMQTEMTTIAFEDNLLLLPFRLHQ